MPHEVLQKTWFLVAKCTERDGSVPVLARVGSLDEERVGGSVRDGAVARALRHDKELAGGEGDRLGAFELDPERAVPAQEQLVLLVAVGRGSALDAGHAQDDGGYRREGPRGVRAPEGGDPVGEGDQ